MCPSHSPPPACCYPEPVRLPPRPRPSPTTIVSPPQGTPTSYLGYRVSGLKVSRSVAISAFQRLRITTTYAGRKSGGRRSGCSHPGLWGICGPKNPNKIHLELEVYGLVGFKQGFRRGEGTMAGEGESRENERRHRPILCLPEHMALAHYRSPGTQGETRVVQRQTGQAATCRSHPGTGWTQWETLPAGGCLLQVSSSWTWLHRAL